jgi:coniferyl-aldehyde dehydrogenase
MFMAWFGLHERTAIRFADPGARGTDVNTATMPIEMPAAEAPARSLEMQRLAYRRDPTPTREQRIASLRLLEAAVRKNKYAFAQAISADFGNRAVPETMLAEVVPTLAGIAHARRNLGGWMRRQRRHVGMNFQPGSAWVEYHPLGCIGIVSPWNYPLLLTLSPLTDALAAGNRVVVKPSEITPRFSALLARIIAETFDPAQVTVVTGGPDVAQAVCALPFDHLVFTGSTSIGRHVMRAAAENLVPVTLELGGKSPAILCRDFDLQAAAKTIAIGKFYNAGQTCIAPDYALVPSDLVETFAQAVLAEARRMYPVIAGNPDYTSIVSDRHYSRLRGLLDEAEAGGGTVLRLDDAGQERRMAPTVVVEPPLDGALMQDEIFGPILPVIGYDDLDEAVEFVNARPRPLSLYVFSNERVSVDTVLARTISGGVTVNGTLLHCIQDDLPFGGVGPSGMGAYHGRDGFTRFSHARGVYKPGKFSGFTFLAAPYGRRMQMALRFMAGK